MGTLVDYWGSIWGPPKYIGICEVMGLEVSCGGSFLITFA